MYMMQEEFAIGLQLNSTTAVEHNIGNINLPYLLTGVEHGASTGTGASVLNLLELLQFSHLDF